MYKIIIEKHSRTSEDEPPICNVVYYPTKNGFLWCKEYHNNLFTEQEVVALYTKFLGSGVSESSSCSYVFKLFKKGKEVFLSDFYSKYRFGGVDQQSLKDPEIFRGYIKGWHFWNWDINLERDCTQKKEKWSVGFRAGQIARVFAIVKNKNKYR